MNSAVLSMSRAGRNVRPVGAVTLAVVGGAMAVMAGPAFAQDATPALTIGYRR